MTTIFFSWQSDVPEHRNILKRALDKAAKSVGDVYIDTATRDEAGAVRIDDKILDKIRKCDLMLADLSIIGKLGKKRRSSPNPNVIYEVGFALGLKGEEVIYLVSQNQASGSDKFPFDLRNRKIAFYDFSNPKIIETLALDFRRWINDYKAAPALESEGLYLDIHAEVGSMGSNGYMIFYFYNDENEPYYLESMYINKGDLLIARHLKGKDNASVSFMVNNYPFTEEVNDFYFVVSRRGKYYRIYQTMILEKRADGKFNLERIVPKIDRVEEIT